MNIDSAAVALSKNGTRGSFHNTFLDFREFHPPISSIELIMQDGSLKEIQNMEIRKKINELHFIVSFEVKLLFLLLLLPSRSK